MNLWSVELEANQYEDDTFNGAYYECLDYCEEHEYQIGTEARLALIDIDEEGTLVECLEIVEDVPWYALMVNDSDDFSNGYYSKQKALDALNDGSEYDYIAVMGIRSGIVDHEIQRGDWR